MCFCFSSSLSVSFLCSQARWLFSFEISQSLTGVHTCIQKSLEESEWLIIIMMVVLMRESSSREKEEKRGEERRESFLFIVSFSMEGFSNLSILASFRTNPIKFWLNLFILSPSVFSLFSFLPLFTLLSLICSPFFPFFSPKQHFLKWMDSFGFLILHLLWDGEYYYSTSFKFMIRKNSEWRERERETNRQRERERVGGKENHRKWAALSLTNQITQLKVGDSSLKKLLFPRRNVNMKEERRKKVRENVTREREGRKWNQQRKERERGKV